MKANFLKIENVKIEKTKSGLVFHLPSNFDGNALRAFKEKHRNKIEELKNS